VNISQTQNKIMSQTVILDRTKTDNVTNSYIRQDQTR
jgi:hypothetical protein